jgi:hypothetical protein
MLQHRLFRQRRAFPSARKMNLNVHQVNALTSTCIVMQYLIVETDLTKMTRVMVCMIGRLYCGGKTSYALVIRGW